MDSKETQLEDIVLRTKPDMSSRITGRLKKGLVVRVVDKRIKAVIGLIYYSICSAKSSWKRNG